MTINTSLAPFSPPLWLANRHVQTILGNGFRPKVFPSYQRRHFPSAHGDLLSIDFLETDSPSPLILILHGISGGSSARNIRYLAYRLHQTPFRVATLNHRGCDGTTPQIPRLYHGGSSDDLAIVVRNLLKYNPGPLILVGLSMGANILLKYFGEQGPNLPHEIIGGCAISSPFDLGRCAHYLESHPWGRIYSRFLLRQLKAKVIHLQRRHNSITLPKPLEKINTFPDFDHYVTARLHGFKDAGEYWEQCSSKRFLPYIRRPVFILNSLDDPFVHPNALPHFTSPWLFFDYQDKGGHLGFLTHGLKPWMEERIIDYINILMQTRPCDKIISMPINTPNVPKRRPQLQFPHNLPDAK